MRSYILALDQGTTSSRAILFDCAGNAISNAQYGFTQHYPKAGWVEHDPMELLCCQQRAAADALALSRVNAADIAGIGITNQRETTVIWERDTGKPLHNAIVWQCRRTAGLCDILEDEGWQEKIRSKCGLVIDAYFSATKIKWILDNIPGARKKAQNGRLLFGTIDTWLIWNMTKGRLHITDYSNASRTMMYNIFELKWDKEILERLDIPECMLPEVMPSSYIYGEVDSDIFGGPVIIGGIAGDQQAALFGQACREPGMVKNTYGTGCFMLMNTGEKPVLSQNKMLTTVAWGINGKVEYALEGSVFTAGAAVQWLRDELHLIDSAPESEDWAVKVENTNGVYIVPAFTGLGAPYWDPYARGTITGLTRGTNKSHIIRAVLESLAYQTFDIIEAMQADSGLSLKTLKVDGGASANDFLMQFQADIIQASVERPACIETTALGAAHLAGLSAGYWADKNEIISDISDISNISDNAIPKTFTPQIALPRRDELLSGWRKAVERSLNWV